MQEPPTPSTQTEPVATPQTPHFFEHLQSYLVGALIGAAAIFAVWGGLTLAAELTQKQIQKEYLAATDEASRASFAKRHATHPLGGLVLLGEAHKYYTDGNYAAAKDAYAKVAASGLKTQPVLLEQALLGQAFSAYALDAQKGLQELKLLAQNPELMQSTRAYAACELAGYWASKGDFKQAKDYMKLVKTFPDARPWQHQISTLGEIYPELSEKPVAKK